MKNIPFLCFIILVVTFSCREEKVEPKQNNEIMRSNVAVKNIQIVDFTDKNNNKEYSSITFKLDLITEGVEDIRLFVYLLDENNKSLTNKSIVFDIKPDKDTASCTFKINGDSVFQQSGSKYAAYLRFGGFVDNMVTNFQNPYKEGYYFESTYKDRTIEIFNGYADFIEIDNNKNGISQKPKKLYLSFNTSSPYYITNSNPIDRKFFLNANLKTADGQIEKIISNKIVEVKTNNDFFSTTIDLDTNFIFSKFEYKNYSINIELQSLSLDSNNIYFSSNVDNIKFESSEKDNVKFIMNHINIVDFIDKDADDYNSKATLKIQISKSDLSQDTVALELRARKFGETQYQYLIKRYDSISISDTISIDINGAETLEKNFYDLELLVYNPNQENLSYYYRTDAVLNFSASNTKVLENVKLEKYSEDVK